VSLENNDMSQVGISNRSQRYLPPRALTSRTDLSSSYI